MQLHDIQPKTKKERKRRVGRGGKKGSFSGRGTKGQRKHGKSGIRPAIRDLIKKVPKLRGEGFPSMPETPEREVVNVGELSQWFKKGDHVTPKTLAERGAIDAVKTPVKLLADGEPPEGLTVQNVPLSRAAKEKIETAGGTIVAAGRTQEVPK